LVTSRQKQWLDQIGSVLESLNQGVIISDEDRRIIFANSMFLEMGKMSAEDILGRSVMDLYPADEVGRLQEFIARRRTEGRAQYEFYIPQSDRGHLPVEVTSRLVHGADGRAYGIITATDISGQKRIQAELSRPMLCCWSANSKWSKSCSSLSGCSKALRPKVSAGAACRCKLTTNLRHP
jgi:PAS domain S-box-containing protein